MDSRIIAILKKLEPITESGCRVWTGAHTYGYGRVDYHGKFTRIHRLIYEHVVGPIPEGMTIDHLCRVKCCANVHHLEAVPLKVNILRSDGVSAMRARQTVCKRGHALTGGNVRIRSNGSRQCVTCRTAFNCSRYRAIKNNREEAGS